MRALLRAVALLVLTLPLMPVQAVAVMLGRPLARRLPAIYHRIVARIIGMDIVVHGAPTEARPALLVGNHVSYLDINLLGAVAEASFIAKMEIAGWLLFGWLAKLQRTVFIVRRSRHAARQRDEIGARLKAGDCLVLFPEGTSSSGIHVLPFKSTLFAVAEGRTRDRGLTVQPFSLAYTRLDGLPVGRDWQPLFAWYGNMDLPSHIWRVLGLGRFTAEITFHQPLRLGDYPSRKAMAEACYAVVAKGVAALHGGGPRQPLPVLPAPGAQDEPPAAGTQA